MEKDTVYENLVRQLDKVRRHCRQGSYKTRERYYEAMKRLCRFLAEEYRVERLANLAPKHVEVYADHLRQTGKSIATIKTDLAAIRFYHDQMPFPRYEKLPTNRDLALERRTYGREDRTWSESEFQKMCALAEVDGKDAYTTLFHLARETGMRIHECFRIDTAMAHRALREGDLHIVGKGGYERNVPLTEDLRERLKKQLAQTQRGQKLFVEPSEMTHTAIHALQTYIWQNRARVQDAENQTDITFHGLRHNFAAETYLRFLEQGKNAAEAEQEVAELLGHHRRDMARVYLASVRQGTKEGTI